MIQHCLEFHTTSCPLQAEDEGEYMCVAKNEMGKVSWKINLDVQSEFFRNIFHPFDTFEAWFVLQSDTGDVCEFQSIITTESQKWRKKEFWNSAANFLSVESCVISTENQEKLDNRITSKIAFLLIFRLSVIQYLLLILIVKLCHIFKSSNEGVWI